MARSIANGAVVSDSGNWVWNSIQWVGLIPNPPDKAPGAVFGSERVQVAKLVKGRSMGDQRAAAEELVRMVREAGSLAAAEDLLANLAAAARTPSTNRTPAPPKVTHPEVQVKTYRDGKDFEKDARRMIEDGWQPDNQSAMDGHVNLGRTLGKAALTGGLGLIFTGASRTKGQITVTWIKPIPTAASEPASGVTSDRYDRLIKLGEMREKGLLSEDEFAAEKARLLAD